MNVSCRSCAGKGGRRRRLPGLVHEASVRRARRSKGVSWHLQENGVIVTESLFPLPADTMTLAASGELEPKLKAAGALNGQSSEE